MSSNYLQVICPNPVGVVCRLALAVAFWHSANFHGVNTPPHSQLQATDVASLKAGPGRAATSRLMSLFKLAPVPHLWGSGQVSTEERKPLVLAVGAVYRL